MSLRDSGRRVAGLICQQTRGHVMESCGGVLNVILRIRLAFASDDNYLSVQWDVDHCSCHDTYKVYNRKSLSLPQSSLR
jgi:hypothetical protein